MAFENRGEAYGVRWRGAWGKLPLPPTYSTFSRTQLEIWPSHVEWTRYYKCVLWLFAVRKAVWTSLGLADRLGG
jgi:hypothetical protein